MNVSEVLERIERRLTAVGLSADAASRQAKKPDAIRNIRRAVREGDGANTTIATINALAPVLQTTSVWLMAGAGPETTVGGSDTTKAAVPAHEASLTQGVSAFKIAAYGGIVEAGSFRTIDDLEDDPERAPFWEPADREFPNLPLVYFDVRGDSMNSLKPRPILPGDRVIAIEFEAFRGNFAMRDGIVVVVEQTRDGGHVRERSLKQVELYEDRIEFHPRSSAKKHKPIVVPKAVFTDPSEDDGRKVAILALARRISNELEL